MGAGTADPRQCRAEPAGGGRGAMRVNQHRDGGRGPICLELGRCANRGWDMRDGWSVCFGTIALTPAHRPSWYLSIKAN